MHHHLPDGATIHVDVLSFFNNIRGINIRHTDNKTRAHAILFEHLKKYGNPSRMVFYVDGAPALEKKETHHERNEKRVKALKTAKVAVETLSNRVSQGKPPTKQMFKNVEKSLRGGFKTEADIDIAAECQPKDVVLSQNSDFFAYDSVTTFWRPVGKRYEVKVLEYNREAVPAQIKLSTAKLTALACVSSNDQNKNIPSMGIATNYSIIKDLLDADVPSLVKEYLKSPRVVCSYQEGIDFTASILVFTTMTQEIAVPAGVSSVLLPSSQPATPLTIFPASSLSYELLCQQYKSPRYSFKARPKPQQHKPPYICKQYQWKPYMAELRKAAKKRQREARRLKMGNEIAKKPPPKIDEMDNQVVARVDHQATLSPNQDDIYPKPPAIENYLPLNKANGGSRRIAPLSPLAASYADFSEQYLISLFWSWLTLKDKIRSMMVEDRYFQDPAIVPSQVDALDWLAKTMYGRLVTAFLLDVELPSDKHGKERPWERLGCLQTKAFDSKEWHGKRYILQGSIRTNGRLLQLLGFKLKELQSVRYRRVPEDKLPYSLVTTISDTTSYLTEARNVFSTAADVESQLTANPSQVAVLSPDLGTSCVVSATISLPPDRTPATLTQPHGKGGDEK
ncbi:hypothetical protein KI688_004236 [Linnemannia hyalina]|uniref:PIN domain-like protein n=1 Tax=Linnemannia hyalina TaxID=64524 RepID=A0A9P8BP05_9FUNG|nr:hypothetical protein KI688_004236 [Linnemannia hyalina]